MAGHGPPPKDPATRQRRNRSSTGSSFEASRAVAPGEIPELPKLSHRRKWDATVVRWWERIWSSGLSSTWLDVDIDGLELIAYLRQDFARARKSTERKNIAGEIRLQERRYGLDVMSRRSLQLEAEFVDPDPSDQGTRERARAARKDPRTELRIVG